MRAAYRTTLRTALVALVATGLAVVAMPESATALPSVCSSGAGNVTNWKGGAGDWKIATNWTNGVPAATNAGACVAQGTVTLPSDPPVTQLHADRGSVVTAPATVFLTFDGNATPSRLG